MANKRLRMFAGPNGSGKSTIFNKIRSQFNLGIYLNADEIENLLRNRNQLSLKEFNLTESHGLKFNTFLQNHSLFQKASSQGYNIDLNCQNGIISNPNNATHSYEASILTDFLRTELIQAGQKITFETVMSHSSKIETLRKLRN